MALIKGSLKRILIRIVFVSMREKSSSHVEQKKKEKAIPEGGDPLLLYLDNPKIPVPASKLVPFASPLLSTYKGRIMLQAHTPSHKGTCKKTNLDQSTQRTSASSA